MSGASEAARPFERALEEIAIADRYRIERVLGQGGMGEVLAVLEPATGKRFALKRLLPGAKPRHAALLSREYHTLASLRHPHVVQAFDFGISEGAPFYTMELLAGCDLESLVPLPWTAVVRILRDVASALSLIHARHLVHRDVGARNVWRTPAGVVKLIDFGAMTSYGASSNLAGTPPYIAPEALRTHVLDQRTDLYSLGALAYYLLTGQHAYPARSFVDLERYWAEPLIAPNVRLSDLKRAELPAIPEALEQLIEALMAAAPEARPSSAAEVLDRLDQVLPGEESVSEVALRGVLASKAFVGRTGERKRLEQLLRPMLEGFGASAVLLGPRGIGRSRLLAELAFDARLFGANAVRVQGDGEATILASAARALLKLLEAVPSAARSAVEPHARVLGHLSEDVRKLLQLEHAELEHFPELHGEARIRLQSALRAVWLEVTKHKPVVLLLDDLQAMDEASIAFFTSLAREAAQRQLLVIAAVRSEDGALPAPVQLLVDKALRLRLGGLALDESHEMLRSIFGDAEHLARTASHLSREAEGNPGRLMEVCEYLVHNEKIRSIDGVWILPHEASELAAPRSLVQLDEARLARLSPAARSLADALSVIAGAIALELCSALSPLPAQHLFPALDELCGAGVLVQGERGYAFRSEALRASLVAALGEESAREAHSAAGEALLSLDEPKVAQRLSAGVHLLRGGSPRRGAEIVYRAVRDLLEHVPDEHVAMAEDIERAYEHASKLGLNDHERLPFLSMLAWAGYFVDRRYGHRYGDEAMACGERVCGMHLARKLAPWLGRKLGLYAALFIAALRTRRLSKKSAIVPDLATAIRLFMTTAACLGGMYTVCMAGDKVHESARAIEPLTALGPDHMTSIVHRFVAGCAMALTDAMGKTRAHWEPLIARLTDPGPITGLSEDMRLYYRAACMYIFGSSEVWRDDSRTLELADCIEKQPIKLYHSSADQIRAAFYAQQGNMREAAYHRARVEAHALERGMTWQVEVWEPSSTVSGAVRQRDAMALKRAGAQLRHLAADTPSLRDYVEIARAMYLNLRGRYAEAAPLLEALLQRRPRDVVGYTNLVASLAHAYNALGRFADAERVASEILATQTAEDLALPGLMLRAQIELALAQAGLGRHGEAEARLDALIAQHTPHKGPLTLGALHDARANVALRAQDEAGALRHMEAMHRWYRSTDCTGLIQHCDRIARRWAKSHAGRADSGVLPGISFLATGGTQLPSTLQQESPMDMLMQLVRSAGASEGALYRPATDAEVRVIKSREDELPEGLNAWVEERMRAALAYTTETEDAEALELSDPNTICLDGKPWQVFVLNAEEGKPDGVVGALVLCAPAAPVTRDSLGTLARQLQAMDDSSVSHVQSA